MHVLEHHLYVLLLTNSHRHYHLRKFILNADFFKFFLKHVIMGTLNILFINLVVYSDNSTYLVSLVLCIICFNEHYFQLKKKTSLYRPNCTIRIIVNT